jgi:hypothetical protein
MAVGSKLYSPTYPRAITGDALLRYLSEELNRVSVAFDLLRNGLQLDTLHVAPASPREGQVAKADGTDWNPGSGAGVYAYIAGSWSLLGASISGGTGSVQSIGITTANGVSAISDGDPADPRLTVTLGDINPSSVMGVTLATGGSATAYLNEQGNYIEITPSGSYMPGGW